VWLALLAATSATCGSFVALLLSLYYATSRSTVVASRETAMSERVTLVIPRLERPASDRVARESPTSSAISPVARTADTPPLDTASRRSDAALTRPGPEPLSAPLSIDAVPWLARPRPDQAITFARPDAHDPFAAPGPPTTEARDSVLHALETMTPELAAQRVLSRAEVDSAAKEAARKMRLSGRTLLVPPDNSGGLIVVRIPLPLLNPGPSNAERVRDRRPVDEGQARLRRLLVRADSLRRARQDSVDRSAPRRREDP